jgi:DNA repair exonuclease SbcCD ATPase subunit
MKSHAKYAPFLGVLVAMTVGAQPQPAKPLTADEMTQQVSQLEAQVESTTRHVLSLQAKARKEKDIIRLTCINDRLVEIKAQQNMFDDMHRQFEGASEQPEEMQAAFAELAAIGERVAELRAEADNCAGVPDLYKQETRADFQEPDLPDDPTQFDPFTPDSLEAPGYASPFN